MKILLISSNSSSAGGGEQYLAYLGKGLCRYGEHVVALISDKTYMDPWEIKFKAAGIDAVRSNLVGLRDRPLRIYQSMIDRAQIDRIAGICRQIKPDIIHVNQQYDADGLDYVMGAMKYARAPVVGTIHMPMSITRHFRNPMDPRTWVITLSGADRLKSRTLRRWYKTHTYEKIFASRAMRDEFADAYDGADDLHVILNGIDIDNMPHTKTAGNVRVFGFCGRLEPQKNPLLLVDAWLAIVKKITPSRLVIIGDGSLRRTLEKKLRRFAPPGSWTITGWVERPLDYLNEIDIFVLPSYFEGLALAAIEAACMGKKCVLAPNPAAKELSEHITWLLTARSHTPSALGESMVMALSSPTPDHTAIMDVRSFFSCERMARDTLNIYQNIKRR